MMFAHRTARWRMVLTGSFTPASIANLIGWWDASDISTLFQTTDTSTPVTTTGDPVGRWSDKSGVGNHVTQSTGSAKPAYTTGVQNGLAGLSHDGGDFLDSASTCPSFPITAVGVAKTSGTVGTSRGLVTLHHSTNFGSRVIFTTGNVVQALVATPSTTRGSVGTVVANTPCVFGYTVAATTITNVLNGTIISPVSHTASAVTNIIRLGASNVNASTSLMNGYLCEVAIYNAALTDAQIGQLAAYLNTKWSVY